MRLCPYLADFSFALLVVSFLKCSWLPSCSCCYPFAFHSLSWFVLLFLLFSPAILVIYSPVVSYVFMSSSSAFGSRASSLSVSSVRFSLHSLVEQRIAREGVHHFSWYGGAFPDSPGCLSILGNIHVEDTAASNWRKRGSIGKREARLTPVRSV